MDNLNLEVADQKVVSAKKSNPNRIQQRPSKTAPGLKVSFLGGVGEIGKNMIVLEYGKDMIVIDAGLSFPTEDMPGIDIIIPDMNYLLINKDRIKGILITHAHEDHIGGIPYLLSQVKIPKVYACGLAVGLIKNKLSQYASLHITLEEYNKNTIYNFKNFEVSFFRTNHSIPDSYGIAIKTIYGYILHTGDFKFDFTPIAEHTDYAKITKFSEKGVILLLSDSTNAGVANLAPSERKISQNINTIFSKISYVASTISTSPDHSAL